MRKTFFFMIALGTFAFIAAPALAGSLVLSKVYSKEELKTACDKNGGLYSESKNSDAFSCVGKKGAVSCTSGICYGQCEKCGQAAPGKGGIGGVLTNAPATKAQPLTPQKTTRSPTTAPTQPLTSQKVTSSKTAPTRPLTSQKVTSSPKTAPTQPLATSGRGNR